MKIGFCAPQNEFANAIFNGLRSRFSGDPIVKWKPDETPPVSDIEVLLTLGPVTRSLMMSFPDLRLVQTLSDGYESVDVDAAAELGIECLTRQPMLPAIPTRLRNTPSS
jgi:lactate dehydrogenase-like 2-hydroxyacid dehydrogenase